MVDATGWKSMQQQKKIGRRDYPYVCAVGNGNSFGWVIPSRCFWDDDTTAPWRSCLCVHYGKSLLSSYSLPQSNLKIERGWPACPEYCTEFCIVMHALESAPPSSLCTLNRIPRSDVGALASEHVLSPQPPKYTWCDV